jgi:pimeloyl-ACP methyl ester carboxylesterase
MLKYFKVKENKVVCWINPRDFGAHEQSLVFIHGSGSNSSVWSHQYAKLHKNYNIAAVSLPGHGKSDGHGEQDIHEYVLRLKEILGALKLESPILIGHSLGAAIALGFATSYPQDISGVVAVGGGLVMPVNPDILKGLREYPDVMIDLICKISLAKENRPKFFDSVRASLAQANIDVLAGDMLACSKFELKGELKKIIVPVLVLCGVEDKMTPPASSEQIAAGIAGAKLVLVEGAGHMVMMEKPAEVNDALTAFCRAIK